MKIIFINRYFYPDHSATSQLLTDLVFSLSARGWNVHVIASRQRYDDPGADLPRHEVMRNVSVHRVRTTRFGRHRLLGRTADYLSFYLAAGWRVWRLARRNDVLVAKTDPPLVGVVALIAARFKRALLVNWLQDIFPEVAIALDVKGLGGLAGRSLCRLRNFTLRKARANVVLGERMARRVTEMVGQTDNIVVIPNWADGVAVSPIPPGQNNLRIDWKLQGKFVVGYSGNMGRVHEFDTFLDAAAQLKEYSDEVVFLWVGDGARKKWLQEQALRRDLGNCVFRAYQPRERLAQSLSVPDVHLVSMLPVLEGLLVPSKFYGVAAAGRPVLWVGDPNGEIGRLVADHRCGFNISPGQGGALADAIKKLHRHPELAEEMGQRARMLFEKRFDARYAMDAWDGLFRMIVR